MKPAHDVTMPATLQVSGVAAIVNGEKVTNQQLVSDFLKNGGQTTLQTLILITELKQAAKKAHITVSNAEITTRLATTKQQLLGRYPGQTWSQVLGARGFSESFAREQVMIQLYVEKLATASQPFSLAGQIHIYHILIATTQLPYATGSHSDADAKKQIDLIRADIVAHKLTFQQAAKKFSEDQATAVKDGDLGWVGQSDPLDPDFKKAAFALKTGEISEPVKSQFGWHLIYMAASGDKATAVEVKKAADESLEARARSLAGPFMQGLQASAKVQNLMIPTPAQPAPANAFPGPTAGRPMSPGMLRPMPRPAPAPQPGKPAPSGSAPPPPPM